MDHRLFVRVPAIRWPTTGHPLIALSKLVRPSGDRALQGAARKVASHSGWCKRWGLLMGVQVLPRTTIW
jgi:hypothetical protein